MSRPVALLGAFALGAAWTASCVPNLDILLAKGSGGAATTTGTVGGGGAIATTTTTTTTGTVGGGGAIATTTTTTGAVDGCSDHTKNGDETDKDCGGSKCSPCDANMACQQATDCKSGLCTSHLCIAPSCTDGVQNAKETDVDCGGDCSPALPCGTSKKCLVASDCESYLCDSKSHTCDPAIVVPPGYMIADMEETETPSQILLVNGRSGNWYTSSDSASSPPGNAVPPTELIPGGRGATSLYGIHAKGKVAAWGGIGVDLNHPPGCNLPYDVTTYGYQGVQFWARADLPLSLHVTAFDADTWQGCPAASSCGDGGLCNDAFGTDVSVSSQWRFYQLSFAAMAQAGWGAHFSKIDLTSLIIIQFGLAAGAYDFWIDDVAFF